VIIHTRNADADTLAILDDEGAGDLGGVIHCFSSGKELADGVLALGFFLSFSGIVTFPKADDVRVVAASAPADRVMAETDAPALISRILPTNTAVAPDLPASLSEWALP